MLAALCKKQLMENFSWLLLKRKDGKGRSTLAMAGLAALLVAAAAGFGASMYAFSEAILSVLRVMGLTWLYFVLLGVIALVIGLFACALTVHSSLYRAKDNDLLLAMPVPPVMILSVRLFIVWIWACADLLILFLPAFLAFWHQAGFTALRLLSGVAVLLALSLVITALSCALGWLIAKLHAHIKHSSIVYLLLLVLFMGGYFWLIANAEALVERLLSNLLLIVPRIREAVRSIAPLYWLGRGAEGSPSHALWLLLLAIVVFAVAFVILERTFLSLATQKAAVSKKAYSEEDMLMRSPFHAMYIKEWKRFLACPVYVLNCGLGAILTPLVGVVMLLKMRDLRPLLTLLPLSTHMLCLIGCGLTCLLSLLCFITAPSISLEGKNLWLAQSLPVSPWTALKAKLALHLTVSSPGVLVLSVCVLLFLKPGAGMAVLMLLVPQLCVLWTAALGLCLNLKMPNLTWTDETYPVKQSLCSLLAMLLPMLLIAALAAVCFLLRTVLSPILCLLFVGTVLLGLSAVLLIWLKGRGARLFSLLG